jgi:hypothetical protein
LQQPNTNPPQPTAPAKKATAGFILSLLSGILVLLDGTIRAAVGRHLLATELFRGELIRISGAIGFILGIIIIVGAILIYVLGKAMVGGIIVLIFAVLSIIGGGGFVIGLILGVIGAVLALMKK